MQPLVADIELDKESKFYRLLSLPAARSSRSPSDSS